MGGGEAVAGGQQEVRERSSLEVVDGRRSVTGVGSVVPREHRKTRDSLQREQVKDKISKNGLQPFSISSTNSVLLSACCL